MRVAVIGAGIVGSSVGWNLAKHGTEVVMLDAGRPGAAVTNWSFSWFNASNKTQTREYFDLNVAGMSEYRQLATEFGQGDWFHPTGHLRWSDTAEGSAQLRRDVEHLQRWGYAVELWSAREVTGLLEPEVHFPSDEAEVALYPDEGWIGGRDLVALLVQSMSTGGATSRFDCPVVGIDVDGGGLVAVEMSDGQRIEVDAVVNAAGPEAGRVAGLVGRRLPMRDEPGLVARVRCEARPVRRAMHAPHVEIRPDGLGRVVLHSREIDARLEPDANVKDLAAELRALAVDVVPALGRAEPVAEQVAWRPIPGDGFPSVGGVGGLSGYYEAVTHSGITLGPVIGRLLAAEIVDHTIDPLVGGYRPDRFGALAG